MKILGIGNAIVDVICKVNDEFIINNNLTKSNMKLIFDENEFKKLLSNLKIEKTVSGGSVANTIVGLSASSFIDIGADSLRLMEINVSLFLMHHLHLSPYKGEMNLKKLRLFSTQ